MAADSVRTYLSLDIASSGDNTVIAAVSGKRIRLLSLLLVVAGDTTAQLKSGSTALTGVMTLKAGGGIVLPQEAMGWAVGGTNEAFKISLGGAVQCSGLLVYVLETP